MDTTQSPGTIKSVPTWSYNYEFRNGLYPIFCDTQTKDICEILKTGDDDFIIVVFDSTSYSYVNDRIEDFKAFIELNLKTFFSKNRSVLINIKSFSIINETNFTEYYPKFGIDTLFITYDRTDARICKFVNPNQNRFNDSDVYLSLLGQIVSESDVYNQKEKQTLFGKRIVSVLAGLSLGLSGSEIQEELLDLTMFPTMEEFNIHIKANMARLMSLCNKRIKR